MHSSWQLTVDGWLTADSRFMNYIQYPVGTRHCRVPTRTMYLTYLKSAVSKPFMNCPLVDRSDTTGNDMRFKIWDWFDSAISVEKPSFFNFCTQFLNTCILISINYEVNLKISKKLQFEVVVSLFQQHFKRILGVELCWLPTIHRQI